MTFSQTLDVICMGRAGVDLYGDQVGSRLEDMQSFSKYAGGCPTNIAIGTSRLGLKSALLSRVGNEHMGRFLRETLMREGVNTDALATDSERLTGLVVLGLRDRQTFPLIFYRENCADMALDSTDVKEEFIASAKALLVSGTHFSTENVDAASRLAMTYARKHNRHVVLDIDYRPVLWGLTGHDLGEQRFVPSRKVSEHIQSFLGDCTVIVGTEEEFHIAGGSEDTVSALQKVRTLTDAVLVVKLGAQGCAYFDGAIPTAIVEESIIPGFPIEVFNELGAGDAFMSGFLRGFLGGKDLKTACRYGNACGAIVVSRHGCSPASPSAEELDYFLEQGSAHFRLREDEDLNHIHWATTRKHALREIMAFAFDHRSQLVDIAGDREDVAGSIAAFKGLCLTAAIQVQDKYKNRGLGILCDGQFGEDTLAASAGRNLWVGRPIEVPGSRPLQLVGGDDAGSSLRVWPEDHCIKCLVFYHPDDAEELKAAQERTVMTLFHSARKNGKELLLEIIPPKGAPRDEATVSDSLARFYDLGVKPDWWKLPAPLNAQEWDNLSEVITARDPYCRGVVMLGLDAPEDQIKQALSLAARQPVCKGFAIGRTIFGNAARAWFAGEATDEQAVMMMKESYDRLVAHWVFVRD
ncbi:bifunctional 5-dehydro-2-deoxygluconokinase/5-dehydro-2-deoxyphosphogluconate aldolase [Paremcibacter congregatus]|uniref:bifunctional 5-dehydro-2-deoxygluconokinase/5-dehydro-2- deoxyphosphogluconate aldolase n=1 Tax=Paremcibacter congregatus TaxID=2043170 RepID=UPI003A925D2B